MSARCTLSTLALSLAIAACAKPAGQTAAAPPAVDSAAVKTAVADLWSRWIAADTAGNVAALTGMWGDSARADIRGMPPIIGRAGAQTFFQTAFKDMKVNAESFMPDMTIPVTNELVYQNGSYTETTTSKGKTATEFGRYAIAFHKDADGQWRFAFVMAFADSTVPKK